MVLLIRVELVKIPLLRVVELHVIYKFALRSFVKFAMVFNLQSSKVGYFETKNQV